MPQGFACSPGAVLWQSRTCLLMTLWSFSFSTFLSLIPQPLWKWSLVNREGEHWQVATQPLMAHTAPKSQVSLDISVVSLPPASLMCECVPAAPQDPKAQGLLSHLHPMWFVCIQSVTVLSRDVPSSGAHHMAEEQGNHRLIF